jgi:photosystem II stability/assembly factor-like uncharacterized protein
VFRRELDVVAPRFLAEVARARLLLARRVVELDPGRAYCRPGGAALLVGRGEPIELGRCAPPGVTGLGGTGCTALVVPEHLPPVIGARGRLRATLTISVPGAALRGLDPGSCRLFWWDERRQNLVLVEQSGLGVDGTYVHGRVSRPGMYTVFGLPADRARRDTLLAWQYLRPWEPVMREVLGREGGDPLHERLCHMIVCSGIVAKAGLDLLGRYGLEPVVTGAPGRPEFVGGRADPLEFGEVRDPGSEEGPLAPPTKPVPPTPPPVSPKSICDECLGEGSAVPPDLGFPPRPRPGDQLAGRTRNQCARWTFVGPTNVAGRVRGFAWHPTVHGVVYLGSSQGGVYKSTNGGASWFSVFGTSEVRYNIGAIAIDTQKPDTVFAGTGEFRVGAGGGWGDGVGIFRTRDGGDHWELLPGPFNRRHSRLVVDPHDSDVVYAVGGDGVMRSLDGGDTWAVINASPCSDMVLDPSNSRRLIVVLDSAPTVAVTEDAAGALPLTWTPLNTGLGAPDAGANFGRIDAVTDPSGRKAMWCKLRRLGPATTASPSGEPNMKLYEWSFTDSRWNERLRVEGVEDTQGDYNNVLAIDPANTKILFHGTRGLWWSSDGGATFMRPGEGHGDQHAVAFDPGDPTRVLIGNDGGVFEVVHAAIPMGGVATVGNLAVTDSNAGHETVQFRNCAVSRTGTLSVVGSTQDQGILRHAGQAVFSSLRGVENGPMAVFPGDGATIWWDPGGGPDYTMLSTRDGGATVRNAGSGLADPFGRGLDAIAIHPQNRSIGLACKDVLYRTTNGAGEPSENVIRIPAKVVEHARDFTCSLWLRTTNTPVPDGSRTLWKNVGNYTLVSGASGVSVDAFVLSRLAALDQPRASGALDELTLRTCLRGVTVDYALSAPIEDDRWHHVAWTRSGDTEALFLDGRALKNKASRRTSSSVSTAPLEVTSLVLGQRQHVIGGGFNYDEAHQDRLRDVRFYGRALAAPEITSLSRGREARSAPDAHYTFQHDGRDSGPHGYTAEIHGPHVAGGIGPRNQGVDFKAFLPVLTGDSITALAIAPSSPERAYAASVTGTVYASHDTGATWTKVGTGPVAGLRIDYLTVDWGDADRIFVGYWLDTPRRVYRSDNAGTHWDDISGDTPEVSLPNMSVTGIVIDPTSSEIVYVAMPIGVFATRNGGSTWAAFDDDLPNAYVSGLDLRVTDNTLYASTFGRGLWRLQL